MKILKKNLTLAEYAKFLVQELIFVKFVNWKFATYVKKGKLIKQKFAIFVL